MRAMVRPCPCVTDNFHLNVDLPWSVIASANVDHGDGNDLMLVLRPGARLPSGGVVQQSFWRRLRDAPQAHLAHQARKASDKAR